MSNSSIQDVVSFPLVRVLSMKYRMGPLAALWHDIHDQSLNRILQYFMLDQRHKILDISATGSVLTPTHLVSLGPRSKSLGKSMN